MLIKPQAAVLSLLVAAVSLTGCNVARTPLASSHEQDARATASAFVDAVRSADGEQLRKLSLADASSSTGELNEAVIRNMVTDRQVQAKLTDHFDYREQRPEVVAGDAWLQQFRDAAAHAPIQQAGDRVRIGEPESPTHVYLRRVDGAWKVEMIPTLVPEAGGEPTLEDPVVTYRFGVATALNEWLLGKFAANQLPSKAEYDKSRSAFWLQYLAHAANGEDPHNTLMSTLPEMPKDERVAQE